MVACTLDPSQIGSAPDNFPLLYFPPRPPAPPHAVTTRYGMVQDTGTLDDASTDRWIPVRTVSPRSPLNALLFAASHVFQPLGWRSWNSTIGGSLSFPGLALLLTPFSSLLLMSSSRLAGAAGTPSGPASTTAPSGRRSTPSPPRTGRWTGLPPRSPSPTSVVRNNNLYCSS